MHITIWNEYIHEQKFEAIRKIYPEGIHKTLGSFLSSGNTISYATLEMPDHGLSEKLLAETDVLIWWGHMAHDQVSDEVVNWVQNAVLNGMGLIVLHSGHASKIFKRLLGTDTGQLKWREAAEKEIIWNINPSHPITQGLSDQFMIEKEEMYGEHFNIPQPDENIFISWFEGGEVFRSGATWHRGLGKVFYFRPGHEAYPTYYDENVRKVIQNAVNWAKKSEGASQPFYGNAQPIIPFQETKNDVNLHEIYEG